VNQWRSEGYLTGLLERALGQPKPDDAEVVIDSFTNAIEHLKTIERAAAALDPELEGHAVFRDPGNVDKAEAFLERAISGNLPPAAPNQTLARGLFETSTSNSLAVKAADAVIRQPGVVYNPLLIHGPSGVGKTHLAHAIGNEILAQLINEPLQVACVNAQRFVDELIAAIAAGSEDQWRGRYRALDVLILDDVHVLAGKDRSQEELFHIFNALQSSARQLVFTSDQLPHTLSGLDDGLRSRLEGGLVVQLDAPDRALREKIVARTLEQRGRGPDSELVRLIADQPVRNLRELTGLVHKLIAAAEARHLSLTAGFVRGETGLGMRGTPSRPSMRAVDSTFLDTEKVVWEWPDPSARLIEELR
jgi:chromosomal replication initiator protein